jgi:hypothetical protein
MKNKYKLVYVENGKEVVLVSTDPSALMIVLHQKVSAHVSKYRDSAAFELISYGLAQEVGNTQHSSETVKAEG